jgi:hypothetical protein
LLNLELIRYLASYGGRDGEAGLSLQSIKAVQEEMEEVPKEEVGVKEGVQQQKPGRPRLHRRQQSLFLPSAMRRSLVSTLNADPVCLLKLTLDFV